MNDTQNPSREVDDIEHELGHTIPVPPKPVITEDHPDSWVAVRGARKGTQLNVVTGRMRFVP